MKFKIIALFMTSVALLNAQKTVPNDLLNTQIYTLSNGLKVYLTVNKTEPKIQTYIAVKAGSKFDPSETTGLAHYLEHLMFKGTPNLGTTNWEKEKVLLAKISDLYEKHKAEKDPAKKKEIYAEIDKTSFEASNYAVPNEYDKIVTSLGAQGTNAYTSNDQTVYINTIPTNELEKWMKLESERFQHLTMRLFHTELETVYEEYNISQDNDGRWAYANLFKALFPNHPYGTQTTIGEGEHLKNPSMVNINAYFNKYYVPNNIAICLSGDLNPEQTVKMIEKYFGSWKSKSIEPFKMPILPEIATPISIENFGPQEETVYVGYRAPKSSDVEVAKAELLDYMLTNGNAGLLDLNLVQKQKVLGGGSFVNSMHDIGAFVLYGKPKEGQTLEEVRDLLLGQVKILKDGSYDDWLMTAAINDIELKLIKGYENNGTRAHAFVTAFTEDIKWEDYVNKIAYMRKLTKKDLVAFANTYFKDNNYAVSYKRKGDAKNPKVDKPTITPVTLNRDTSSAFFKEVMSVKSSELNPQYIDYKKEIQTQKLKNGLEISYVGNKENNYAKLCVIFPFGKDHSKDMEIATKYFDYLGTESKTSEEFQIELYKNGLEITSRVDRTRTIITLAGLEQNFDNGIKLLMEKLENCTVNQEAWGNMIQDILKERENAKTNKNQSFRAFTYYARYGEKNPYNTVYNNEELKSLKAEDMVKELKNLMDYTHSFFFYGKNLEAITPVIDELTSDNPSNTPAPKALYDFTLAPSDTKKILTYNYPEMVQANIVLYSNEGEFDKNLMPFINMYNDFFGSGLSSIVFQELREQKALAYSAYSYFGLPSEKGENFFLQSFIGTQADKMPTAAKELKALLDKTPTVEIQFNNSKESALKQIASDRIVRDNIYWSYLNYQNLGIDYDIRQEIFSAITKTNLAEFSKTFNQTVANNSYVTAIMGDLSKLKLDEVKEFGEIEEVSSEKLFGY